MVNRVPVGGGRGGGGEWKSLQGGAMDPRQESPFAWLVPGDYHLGSTGSGRTCVVISSYCTS